MKTNEEIIEELLYPNLLRTKKVYKDDIDTKSFEQFEKQLLNILDQKDKEMEEIGKKLFELPFSLPRIYIEKTINGIDVMDEYNGELRAEIMKLIK